MSKSRRRAAPDEPAATEAGPSLCSGQFAWTVEAPPEELSIQEHAEALALVDALRPYCTGWAVELQRPEIAREIGLVLAGNSATPVWAVYRDVNGLLHFEDLVGGHSYLFCSMTAGLRLARAVLEAAAARAAEDSSRTAWWEGLPHWLLADASGPVAG